MKIGFTPTKAYQNLGIASLIVVSAFFAEAQSTGTVAKFPYRVSAFAGPPSVLTHPDSITTANGNIYVVYANATNPCGTGGFSTMVEYSVTGKILGTFEWQERLTDKMDYTYAQQPFHGGGYDDIVFAKGENIHQCFEPYRRQEWAK
jgi:hypothetical protein